MNQINLYIVTSKSKILQLACQCFIPNYYNVALLLEKQY